MKPLVSVNVATYNRANLLPRCLDSVLSQSYENMEIIIVDDCSNDNTDKIIKQYQERYKCIQYIKHITNRKLPSTRNSAWQNSNGKYIAFMDDDDEWIDKDKIKKQVEILEHTNDDKLVLVCSSVRLYGNKNNYKDKIITKPKDLVHHILKGNGIMYTPAVIVKADVVQQVGGFDTNLPRGIDSDFYRMCIVKFGYDVHFMGKVTTGVHEYGVDRITPTMSWEAMKKTYKAHFYIIMKYNYHFLLHPISLLKRLRTIQAITFEYLKQRLK